jgi:Sugar phosphate permease
MAAEIMQNYMLSNSQFAGIFSAPMIPAIFLSLIAGIMVDKFGAKKVILFSIIVSTIGALLRLHAQSYGILFTAMLLTGFSATFLNSNGAKILGNWFPREKISSVMGIFLAVSNIGMALGMGTTALLPHIKTAFFLALILGIITIIAWTVFMKEAERAEEEKDNVSIGEALKIVMKNKYNWIVAICLMFIMGGNVTLSTFLPSALSSRGINAVNAGVISMLMTVGNLAGSIIVPIFSQKVRNIKWIIILLGAVAAVFTVVALRMPQGILLNLCLFAVGVAVGGLIPLLMSIPICLPEIGPKYAGTAGGFICSIELLGAVVIPSHIITSITSDITTIFTLAGICIACGCVHCLMLPRTLKV